MTDNFTHPNAEIESHLQADVEGLHNSAQIDGVANTIGSLVADEVLSTDIEVPEKRQRGISEEEISRREAEIAALDFERISEIPSSQFSDFSDYQIKLGIARYAYGKIRQRYPGRKFGLRTFADRANLSGPYLSLDYLGFKEPTMGEPGTRHRHRRYRTMDKVFSATVGILLEEAPDAVQSMPERVLKNIVEASEFFGIAIETVKAGDEISPNSRNRLSRAHAERAMIDAIRNGNTALIVGPPDSGKSSLVLYAEKYAGNHAVIRVDGKSIDVADEDSIYSSLYQQIRREILDRNLATKDIPGAKKQDERITPLDIMHLINCTRKNEFFEPVLIVDNFNINENSGTRSQVAQILFHIDRLASGITRRTDHFGLIMFGLERYTDFDRSPSAWLKFFSRDELGELVKILGASKRFDPEEVHKITGGQPMLTQAYLQNGPGRQFEAMANNHIMRLAQMIVEDRAALGEFERLMQIGSSIGYVLEGMGILNIDHTWSSSLYEERLPGAIELLQSIQ